MANIFTVKESSIAGKVPTATDLEQAELAVNLADKKIYSKDGGGNIIELCAAVEGKEQTVTPAAGVVTIDTSLGRNVLLNVTGPVTAVNIVDPGNPPTGAIEMKLTTDGSAIAWTGITDWVGAHPTVYPKGGHILTFRKIGGAWHGKYEGTIGP